MLRALVPFITFTQSPPHAGPSPPGFFRRSGERGPESGGVRLPNRRGYLRGSCAWG